MYIHPAKFGGHMHGGSGYKIILVCHVILQDHVIQGSCDFMGGIPQVTRPLVFTPIVVVEI